MSVPFSVPTFEHEENLHDIFLALNPRKGIRSGKILVVVFLACAAIPYLGNGKGHPLIDPDAFNMLFLACIFLMALYILTTINKVGRSETSPLYLRYNSHDSPKNLEYRAQIRLVVIVQIFFVAIGCLAIVMWNFPFQYRWVDAINPWFLHTHGHTRWATTCFVGYTGLVFGLLLVVFTPSCAIRFSADRVRVSTRFIFLHWTRVTLDRMWDELETILFVQSEGISNYTLKMAPTMVGAHSGYNPYTTMETTNTTRQFFPLPKMLIIDPCWLTYVARVMVQLPDAGARQDFLDNLVNYAPPGTKVRYKR